MVSAQTRPARNPSGSQVGGGVAARRQTAAIFQTNAKRKVGREICGFLPKAATKHKSRANNALIILIAFTPGLIRIPGSVYQNKL
jgi:hypothetical protein